MGQIPCDLVINLADEYEYLQYFSRVELIKEMVEAHQPKTIFIDEIQRIPKLLNTIQTLIDKNKSLKFYLTGSSARKLKRGEANLLPGRLVNFQLGPICAQELHYKIDTKKILNYGSLPEIYLSANDEHSQKDIQRILKSYSANYIKEEIKAEALVRNLESFARFFQECFKNVAQTIDYSKLAKNAKVSRHAIPRYFEILEDSLVAFRLYPYDGQVNDAQLIKHPKFYFFDNGVYNGLMQNFMASPDRIGVLAEQLVFSQLQHSASANEIDIKTFFYRDRNGREVDFILEKSGEVFAIEVKTTDDLSSQDIYGLMAFQQQTQNKNLSVWHMGQKEKKIGSVWAVPWQKGLQNIGL